MLSLSKSGRLHAAVTACFFASAGCFGFFDEPCPENLPASVSGTFVAEREEPIVAPGVPADDPRNITILKIEALPDGVYIIHYRASGKLYVERWRRADLPAATSADASSP